MTQRPFTFLQPSFFQAWSRFGSRRTTDRKWARASASRPFASHQAASLLCSSTVSLRASRRARYSARGRRAVGHPRRPLGDLLGPTPGVAVLHLAEQGAGQAVLRVGQDRQGQVPRPLRASAHAPRTRRPASPGRRRRGRRARLEGRVGLRRRRRAAGPRLPAAPRSPGPPHPPGRASPSPASPIGRGRRPADRCCLPTPECRDTADLRRNPTNHARKHQAKIPGASDRAAGAVSIISVRDGAGSIKSAGRAIFGRGGGSWRKVDRAGRRSWSVGRSRRGSSGRWSGPSRPSSGEERTIAVLRGTIAGLAREAGAELARSLGDASLAAFASCLDTLDRRATPWRSGLLEQSPDRLDSTSSAAGTPRCTGPSAWPTWARAI